MPIHRIAYYSTPQPTLTSDDLEAIVKVARTRNAELKISGVLLHVFGQFIQLLEGPAGSIERVMEAIVRDNRHSDIHIFLKQSGAVRSFERWAMWSDYVGGDLTSDEQREREALQQAALKALADMDREAVISARAVPAPEAIPPGR
ncbi:BLUF domain-containing protein [Fulvimarina sp. MAC3]|uniref:BLUF domain-containing protein n=1 Tax=Fulvimarina sp. MAC3 TaxID=3148887 RepID=UPI0031FC34DB